jgi:hypothetical protein
VRSEPRCLPGQLSPSLLPGYTTRERSNKDRGEERTRSVDYAPHPAKDRRGCDTLTPTMQSSLFIRLLYDFRCHPVLKAPRNSCSASWTRAGVVHQNDGDERRTGTRRDCVCQGAVDVVMNGCRRCASFHGCAIVGAGYHYQCSLRAAVPGSQAALMPP